MPPDWAGPAAILRASVQSYRLDRWEDQAFHVEVWCEKDALSSVLEPGLQALPCAPARQPGV